MNRRRLLSEKPSCLATSTVDNRTGNTAYDTKTKISFIEMTVRRRLFIGYLPVGEPPISAKIQGLCNGKQHYNHKPYCWSITGF